MPNHMKFCGCANCRRGMHSKRGGTLVRRAVRRQRHEAKEALRRHRQPDTLSHVSSVTYTD